MIKSFSIYTLVSIVGRGINFILLPVLTDYLSPADYGLLVIVLTIYSIVEPLVTIGLPAAVDIQYIKESNSQFNAYLKSAIVNSFCACLILTVIFFLFGVFFANQLNFAVYWLFLMPSVGLFKTFESILSAQLIIRKRALKFAYFSIIALLLNIIISLFLVVFLETGYIGRLWGIFLSSFIAGSFVLYIAIKEKIFQADYIDAYRKGAFLFGFPIIFHSLSHIAINSGDRLFISYIMGNEELGIYNVGYTIGSVIVILSASFMSAWSPLFYEKLQEGKEAYQQIVKINYLYLILIGLGVFVLWLITPFVFDIFIDERYNEGTNYVLIVGLSYFFYAIYQIFSTVLSFEKKTKIFGYLALFNSILNCILNYFLIIEYGAIGAAYATLITFILFALIIGIVSHRVTPLPWLYFIKGR